MCIFSTPVESVSNTSIFARALPEGRQALVYSMTVSSREPVAMVLPLPVPEGSGEDAVHFVNLEGYPDFFKDMREGFPTRYATGRGGCHPFFWLLRSSAGPPPLVVHDVGSFEASYVPSVEDWGRLDPRFRMPECVFETLPEYASYGFAVFKLKSSLQRLWYTLFLRKGLRKRTIHPMALVFPKRDSSALFFPTVHVHDGQIELQAHFDHTLYTQCSPETAKHLNVFDEQGYYANHGSLEAYKKAREAGSDETRQDFIDRTTQEYDEKLEAWESHPPSWTVSRRSARDFVDVEKSGALVEPGWPVYRAFLEGQLSNQDTLVTLSPGPSPLP